jgi:phosphotriesterase-related protein
MAGGIAATILKPVVGVPQAAIARRDAVQTVLGPLDESRLGFTLPHEHIADPPYYLDKWPKAWGGRAGFVARAVEKLKRVRAAGISTIVDLTPYDVGRDIRFLEEVSRKSGLNLVACTGQRFFPPTTEVTMPSRTVAGLAGYFVKEIEQGIDGTDIKAGVIKIGIVGTTCFLSWRVRAWIRQGCPSITAMTAARWIIIWGWCGAVIRLAWTMFIAG